MSEILDLMDLAGRLEEARNRGKVIVHCHGCFDLMHPGHIKHLQAAKRMGDVLVVTQKIVSKAEGRIVALDSVHPSPTARAWAERWHKDARQVELVLRNLIANAVDALSARLAPDAVVQRRVA